MKSEAAKKVTLESVSTTVERLAISVDSISKSIAHLPTREEMDHSINQAVDKGIESLAQSVAKGFAGVDKRFDELDSRLSGRIDSLENKVDAMDSRLTNQLDYVLLHYTRREEHILHDKRLKRVEKKAFA